MRRPTFIARQSARPRGLLGRIVAGVMRGETASDNDIALDALDPEPTDRVLEIGFGPGRTIACLAERVPDGRVAGVDHSELMLRVASRANAAAIRDGRVDLRVADSIALPFADARFDRAIAVHTVYFWQPAGPHLEECARVLRPGGRLVLAYRPFEDRAAVDSFPSGVYRFMDRDEVRDRLARAGFRGTRIETRRDGDRRLDLAVARAPGR